MQKLTIAVVLFLAGTASAQYVQVLPRAATPLVVSTIHGGVPYFQVHATGPLMSEGTVSVSTPPSPGSANSGRASFEWSVYPSWTTMLEECWIDTSFNGHLTTAGGAALASVGTHDLVVDVHAFAPRKVLIDIDFTANLAGASQPPVLEVDVADDGVIDAHLGDGHVLVPLQLGVAAVPLRLRCSTAIGTPNPGSATAATMDGGVSIRIRPDNDLSVQEVVPGCDGGWLECGPEFASNGVRLASNTGPLTVLLLGAQSQPWIYNGTLGVCNVVPSPDVLLSMNGLLSLPIPASVRPFTFYVQALFVASYGWVATGIGATSAFRISAW